MYVFVCVYMRAYMHACVYLSNPSTTNRMQPRSIFKQSKADLNLKFSFSETGCLIKGKKNPVCPTIYP